MTATIDIFDLFTDGGSRGNPGPASAGAIIRDPSGKIVFAGARFLGRVTNNVAEYQAVVAVLEEACRRGCSGIRLHSDSELLVRQIQGRYKVKSPDLRPLHARVMELLNRFKRAEVLHIRREGNSEADALVNQSLDARRDVGDWGGARAGTDGPTEAPKPAPDWPPSVFTAACQADGCEDCPGVVSAGGEWRFDGTVPPGLCVHAATGILRALHDSKPGARQVLARCAKPGCGARFTLQLG